MPYRVLKGELAVTGKSPDGDTVAFFIDKESIGDWVYPKPGGGRFPKFNKSFHANVRFEAIDALELHFTPKFVWPVINSHQPLELARAARNRMLSLCGFDLEQVEIDENEKLTDRADQRIPAVVAYNGIDPFGRLIGFVFHPDDAPPLSNDSKHEQYLEVEQVLKSINATLLAEGYAVPTFYSGLYPPIRNALAQLAIDARNATPPLGVWKDYVSEIVLPRKPDICAIEEIVLMPKVYRRLAENIARNGAMSRLSEFLWDKGDDLIDIRDVRATGFGSFLKARKEGPDSDPVYRLTLSRKPEELIFTPE